MDLSGENIAVLPFEDIQYLDDSYNTHLSNENLVDEQNNYHTHIVLPKVKNKPAASAHVCSLTWVSEEVKEKDNFRRMQSNIGFIAANSPFVPSNMDEWIMHRVAVLEAKARRMRKHIATRDSQRGSHCKEIVQPVLLGKILGDCRSTVLARETIWRLDEINNPSKPQAPWPDSSERKHEGYQRVRSGYSRFLPLPRVPGNPTVNWKQRSPIAIYEFDQVGQPILAHDTPVDMDEAMEVLIGSSLFAELNA